MDTTSTFPETFDIKAISDQIDFVRFEFDKWDLVAERDITGATKGDIDRLESKIDRILELLENK